MMFSLGHRTEMSQILHAIAQGLTVTQVRLRVLGTYPDVIFLAIGLIESSLVDEVVSAAACAEIRQRHGSVDDADYVNYLVEEAVLGHRTKNLRVTSLADSATG